MAKATTTELLTVREVARLLRCSIQHVHNLIENGRLEAFNIATHRAKRASWRISAKSLTRLLNPLR